jgi:hypothetical protein
VLPQEFIRDRIADTHEHGGVVVGIRVEAAFPHDFIRPRPRTLCIHGEFQVIAKGFRLQPPGQHASRE